MQSLRLYLCLSILPILFSSCDLLLGVDNSATPLNVYNGMFELLRNNYAYQSEMPEPLDTIYNRYIDRVKTLKDDEKKTLAQILTDVVGDIQDGHVFLSNLGADNLQLKWPPYNIYPPPEQGDPGYDEYQKANEQYIKESQYPNIRGTIKILGEPYGFRYGYVIARADIGYIQPTALFSEGGFSGTGRLQGNDWKTKIDEILAELKNRGVNKMILDLRSRIGGSQYNAAVIAARFLRERRNYMHSYDLIGPADKPGSYRKITHTVSGTLERVSPEKWWYWSIAIPEAEGKFFYLPPAKYRILP
ncbi:MAG: S41 family peptidase [Spirochaetota bacterium]